MFGYIAVVFWNSKSLLITPKSSFVKGRILIFYCRILKYTLKRTPRGRAYTEWRATF